ncbi:diguanylate cyclase domain-containing protein [Azohydromonas aeria]|uniref:diguanylate cyclase domain-containing protein n=1 Tax=Azohydromonas aeria TaxID=2590212 RepID=UPI0018DF95D1|nr:diguanylate cyclase [Azohydromonas aeria]
MQARADKILFVDDDTGMIQALSRILSEYPNRRFARSGHDALRRAAEEPPDLILLDAEMPDMSGFEVCKALKNDARFAATPIIFITSHDDPQVEASVFDLGAADFIAKPVNPAVVRARVDMQLRLRRMTAELEALARSDALTGLANRRVFDERLERECARTLRRGGPLSLLLVDVDHFKAYNDHYGHAAGDACLREVAAALRASVHRPDDLAARYGGEEFALLLPETDATGADTVAARVLDALAVRGLPHAASRSAAHVSASIGVACLRPEDEVLDRAAAAAALLEQADQALYAAKAAGRARAWHFNPALARAGLAQTA